MYGNQYNLGHPGGGVDRNSGYAFVGQASSFANRAIFCHFHTVKRDADRVCSIGTGVLPKTGERRGGEEENGMLRRDALL